MEKWTRFTSRWGFLGAMLMSKFWKQEIMSPPALWMSLFSSLTPNVCYWGACTFLPLCLSSFYTCSIKVIFRSVCLTEMSFSSATFDGQISLTLVCENTEMFPQGGTSLLIYYSKLYNSVHWVTLQRRSSDLWLQHCSLGLWKARIHAGLETLDLLERCIQISLCDFFSLPSFSWKVKSYYASG